VVPSVAMPLGKKVTTPPVLVVTVTAPHCAGAPQAGRVGVPVMSVITESPLPPISPTYRSLCAPPASVCSSIAKPPDEPRPSEVDPTWLSTALPPLVRADGSVTAITPPDLV
jgi:hypothetical protein